MRYVHAMRMNDWLRLVITKSHLKGPALGIPEDDFVSLLHLTSCL